MRALVVHILAVLLIAIFALGAPQYATADCLKCHDCDTGAPAKNNAPCPEKGMVCQVAQTCANQVQKSPVQLNVDELGAAGQSGFIFGFSIAFKSAYLTPETAPPRA
ncbi:MAG TPA: hypothetical protein VJV39_19585 [Dongiaceae bacterium]|nr:hypothetical protein [Dongiaceae bacterium]